VAARGRQCGTGDVHWRSSWRWRPVSARGGFYHCMPTRRSPPDTISSSASFQIRHPRGHSSTGGYAGSRRCLAQIVHLSSLPSGCLAGSDTPSCYPTRDREGLFVEPTRRVGLFVFVLFRVHILVWYDPDAVSANGVGLASVYRAQKLLCVWEACICTPYLVVTIASHTYTYPMFEICNTAASNRPCLYAFILHLCICFVCACYHAHMYTNKVLDSRRTAVFGVFNLAFDSTLFRTKNAHEVKHCECD
jgi:hypothetical protein